MEHTKEYVQVCNKILKALQEITMWTEAMETAIEGVLETVGNEKIMLIETISEEIIQVEQRLVDLKYKFYTLINNKPKT